MALQPLRAFTKSCTRFIEQMQTGTGAPERPVWHEPPLPAGVVEVEAGALQRIFAFVQVLKKTKGFSSIMAADLCLNPRPAGAGHSEPAFQASTTMGEEVEIVKLRFFKYGHEGVWIEGRRGGPEAPWEYLGITTSSPWFDKRPLLVAGQPEVREYRMRFWDKGEPTGEWSAVKKATVSP